MPDFKQLLRERYPKQSYALFFEVQSATAYQGRQRADALAMGLWPSRGLDVIGFEFKAHRGDWLRELRSPDKAEEIFQFCDQWYLVADEHTAHADEIPATWGWLCPGEKGLREAKSAPKLAAKPLAREFVTSLLRSAQKDRDQAAEKPRAEIEAKVRAEQAKEFQDTIGQLTEQLQQRESQYRKEKRRIEEALGINFGGWGGTPIETIGAAVRLVLEGSTNLRALMEEAAAKIQQVGEQMEEAKKGLATWPNVGDGHVPSNGQDRE
jgi:hypothetical protein